MWQQMLVQVKTDSPVSVVGWCLRYENAEKETQVNGDVDLEVVMRTATGTGGNDDLGLVGMECDEKAGEYFDHEKAL